MRQKSKVLLTLLLAFVVQLGFAQEKTITGTVTGSDGMPLIGVNVVVEGTTTGAITNFDGNYSIEAATGQTLVFTYVGYKTKKVAVGADTTIDITMNADAAKLEEVVIMGYISKSADNLTGSAKQISGEDIAEVPSVTVTSALQGKVAGVSVSSSSGTPGAVQDIRIRGISSLTAENDPLYVINGVPVITGNISGSDNRTTLSPLASINSSNIESMTVLKDAAATAAYGARGANGVIVITTKDGKKGETTFAFNMSIGTKNDAYNERKVLTGPQKMVLLKEGIVNSFGQGFGVDESTALQFAVNMLGLNPNLLNYKGELYNWSEAIKNEDALMQNYTFSASGGGEKGSFYASLGYNKTEATVKGSDFERVVGTFSFNRQLRDNVKFSTNMSFSNVKQNPLLERGSFFSNPYITRYLMSPWNPIYGKDGKYEINLPFGALPNIFYVLENDYYRNMLNRGIVNAKLDWEIVNNLTFSNTVALDYQDSEFKQYNNRYEGDGDGATNGTASVEDTKNFNYVIQSSLGYDFDLANGHNLNAKVLFEYQKNENFLLYAYGENFPVDGLKSLDLATKAFDVFSSFEDWYNVSYLALVNYDYKSKYVLDLTYRREGSSKFVKSDRFGNFWAVGAAWNIDKEDFIPEEFSTLKLRGSYGVTGNSGVEVNQYQPLLGFGDYNFGGTALAVQFGNEELTWEKNAMVDFGVEFGLWNERLTGSATYFNRRSYDLLYAVPLSLTTGFSQQFINAGEMTNKGLEFSLGYDIFRTQDFTWHIQANLATVENEITKLPLGTDGKPLDRFSGGVYKTDRVGMPTGTWYMPTWAGVDPQTGLGTWYVNGHDGATTSDYGSAERVTHDSALPTYTGGVSTHLEYKGFFADASIYFAGGHQIYEQYAQFYLKPNQFTSYSYNGVQALLNRWQKPGDITNVPKMRIGAESFARTSTRHLYEGDYIRLKNVSLGYNLPSKYAEAIGMDALTVTVRGSNLVTWLKDDGLKLDPEVRADGFTRLSTPPTKSVVFGINVKF